MKKSILLLQFAILCCGCATKVTFTESMRNDLERSGITPDKLQFYTTNQIVLQKSSNSTEGDIKEGNIKINNLVVRDKVVFGGVINNYALGICKDYKPKKLGIYFEEGDSLKRIYFMPDKKGVYVLPAYSKIHYDNQYYEIAYGKLTKLQISKSQFTKYVTNVRKTKGLKIDK